MKQHYNNISRLNLNLEIDAAATGSFSGWLKVCVLPLQPGKSVFELASPSFPSSSLPQLTLLCPAALLGFLLTTQVRDKGYFLSHWFFPHRFVVNKNLSWRDPAHWNAYAAQFYYYYYFFLKNKHLIYSGNGSSFNQFVMWFTYLGIFLIKHWSTNKQIIAVSGEAVDLRLTVAHLSLS